MAPGDFAVALALTVAIEGAVSFCFGYRGRIFYIALVLANLVTNPALNYLLTIMWTFGPRGLYYPAMALLEAAAVLIEWRLLLSVLGRDSRRLLALSIVMNSISCLAGILLDIFFR